MSQPPLEMKHRGKQEANQQHTVKERKDPQRSSNIKILEVPVRIEGVDKNSSNQEAGEHEEQIDSEPPAAAQPSGHLRGKRMEMSGQKCMAGKHQQNRQTAKTIQSVVMFVGSLGLQICAPGNPQWLMLATCH